MPNNIYVIMGEPETKTIQDLAPGIIDQLSKKQVENLKKANINLEKTKKAKEGGESGEEGDESDSDEIPDLVDQNFEETSK